MKTKSEQLFEGFLTANDIRFEKIVFAKVKIPYDQLPPCFDVPRIDVSTEPLTLP
jgi:hypothetical protein